MIEIYHLIYFREGGNKPQYYQIIRRRLWDFKIKGRRLDRSSFTPFLPHHHLETLHNYYDQWYYVPSEFHNDRMLEFTYGVDEESGISAIAIKHPRDNYNKKIGRAMVEGRIKRMKGEIEGREPYDLNEFFLVYKEE